MNPNEQLIHTFYTAFQNKDYKTMQACYADNLVFNDEAFQNLSSQEAKAMWHMLIQNGKDLVLSFDNIQADDTSGTCDWMATYTFSRTKNKVMNRIHANFSFENGKIVRHTDSFPFYKWASQAFGLTGKLIGWTPFFKQKIRTETKKLLSKFMQDKGY